MGKTRSKTAKPIRVKQNTDKPTHPHKLLWFLAISFVGLMTFTSGAFTNLQGVSAATPATVFVATTGDDSNTGLTQEEPLRTLKAAFNKAEVGKQLRVSVLGQEIKLATTDLANDKEVPEVKIGRDIILSPAVLTTPKGKVRITSTRPQSVRWQNDGRLQVINFNFVDIAVTVTGSGSTIVSANDFRPTRAFNLGNLLTVNTSAKATNSSILGNLFILPVTILRESEMGAINTTVEKPSKMTIRRNRIIYPATKNVPENFVYYGIALNRSEEDKTLGSTVVDYNTFETTSFGKLKDVPGQVGIVVRSVESGVRFYGNTFKKFSGTDKSVQ